MPLLKKIVPSWIYTYPKSNLKNDSLAGISLAILMLPQCMAYALLAGMPPVYGIFSILAALPIYAIVGQQKTIAVGPAAMVSILVSTSLMPFYESSSAEYIIAASALSALSGLFLLLLGYLKLGFISNFISRPVISGYSFAVGILVVLSQSKYVFNVEVENGNIIQSLISLREGIYAQFNWQIVTVSIIGLALLITGKKISPKIPTPLLLIILSIALVYFLPKTWGFAPSIGEIPSLIPNISTDFINLELLKKLWPSAAIMALIIYLEISTVSQVAQKHQQEYNGNRELKAMGLANLFGAFFKAFPVSTSFSRSLFNKDNGAKTQLSSIFALIIVLLIVFSFKEQFALLPTYILAIVVIATVVSLINFKESKAFFRSDKKEFVVHVLTIVCTLFFGIKEGLITGILASLVLVIYRSSNPHIATLGYLPKANAFMNTKRFEESITYPHIEILRPDAQFYHGNISSVCHFIGKRIDNRQDLKHVILQCSAVNYIDSSAIKALVLFDKLCKEKGTQLLFCKLKGPVRDQLKKWEFYKAIGEDHFFNDVRSALDFCEGKVPNEQFLAKQSNYKP